MTTIRRLNDEDELTWRLLWTQYLAFDGSTLDAAIYDRTWARLLDVNMPVHGALARDGDQVVGFVHYIFHPSTWSISDSCYLQDLFVLNGARGKGYGRTLIDHVCAQAAAAGSSRVYWQTQHDNAPAIALYEKLAKRTPYIQFQMAARRPAERRS